VLSSTGGEQREAFIRTALPCFEANVKGHREALQNALNLAEEPQRIESFDISHIQERIPSRPWCLGKRRMKKSDYRKFIIRGDDGGNGVLPRLNDDFASMRER